MSSAILELVSSFRGEIGPLTSACAEINHASCMLLSFHACTLCPSHVSSCRALLKACLF